MVTLVSSSFNGGEVSPLMLGKVDRVSYQSGCALMRNMVCLAQGPTTRRPGTKFIGFSRSKDSRLIGFTFSTRDSTVLDFYPNGVHDIFKDLTVTTPFTASDVKKLRVAQSADVMYVASAAHPPSKVYRTPSGESYSWNYDVINFTPQTTPPTNTSVTSVVGVPTPGKRTYKYVVTAINPVTGEESVPSPVASIRMDLLNSIDGNTATVHWEYSGSVLEFKVYKEEAGIFGYIGTADAASRMFDDININADASDAPPSSDNPFDAENKYPSLVFFWQQRLGWAASRELPFTVWMSPSAQFESMSRSKPPNDDDAIEATLAATQANIISWVAADRNLVIGTSGSEWTMGGTDGTPITASKAGFNLQDSKGGEAIQPISASGALLYVQRGGKVLREFAYAYASDKYSAADITVMASHLFDDNSVVDWCYQLNPYQIIWVLLDDGTLLGCTYMREHKVLGWHKHDLGGVVKSLCSVPGYDEDKVYVAVDRGHDVLCIEELQGFFTGSNLIEDAFFVDSGATYVSDEPVMEAPQLLPHLAGRSVAVWADGAEQPEALVSEDGTVALLTAARKITAGLAMQATLKPLRPDMATEQGATHGKAYKTSKAVLEVYNTAGILVGAEESNTYEAVVHDASAPTVPGFVHKGYVEAYVDSGWTDAWDLTIKSSGPGPMTLISATYEIEIGEDL